MTILTGPWTGAPVVQAAELERRIQETKGREGYAKPEHRPRADLCPPICHACPLLRNPDGRYDVMPGCHDGAMMNALEACICDYDGPPTAGMGASY